LKLEQIHRRPWSAVEEARTATAEYIEVFYYRRRKHSCLGYVSPAEYDN